ncbi:hypothetical protein ONZ45_g8425 [Pleurotus djamor]|nr:hypothetical protein ONZ45_g8425 [Pleurotus djamor]
MTPTTSPAPLPSTFTPRTHGLGDYFREAYDRILQIERAFIAQQKTDDDIAPLRVLGYLLQEELDRMGFNRLAKAINTAHEDQLVPLGHFYIKYFIRIFYRNRGLTPQPSHHPSRDSFNTARDLLLTDPGSLSHSQARELVFERDGHRNLVTGAYSFELSPAANEFHNRWPIDRVYLYAMHIIPDYLAKISSNANGNVLHNTGDTAMEALVDFPPHVDKPERSTMWKMLESFSGTDIYEELAGNLIHLHVASGSNGRRDQFVDGKRQWKVCHTREALRAHGAGGLVHFVTFPGDPNNHNASDCRPPSGSFPTTMATIPAPNPTYLCLHAPACRVAWMSGATNLLENALAPSDSWFGPIPPDEIVRVALARLQYDFTGPKVLNAMEHLSTDT